MPLGAFPSTVPGMESFAPSFASEPFDEFAPPPPPDDYDDGGWVPPEDYGALDAIPLPEDPLGEVLPFELDENLNPGQRQAATILEGPVMAIAGPGAGKTNTLVQRIGNLISSGAAAPGIVAWTFTNKAGREIADRVATVVGRGATRGMFAGTFHSWCLRFIKQELDVVGLRRDFEIISDADRKKLIRAAMKEHNVVMDDVAKNISFAKGQAPTLNGAYQYVLGGGMSVEDPTRFVEVWQTYERVKLQRNLVDFDDLILMTVQALGNPEVLTRWRQRVDHLLVDEYQDTNPAQHALVTLLAQSTISTFIVGDTDQSVYAFRGAYPGIMNTFREDFPATQVVVLEENYRSTGQILDSVREIISRNPAELRSPLRTTRETGGAVQVRTFSDDASEARGIAAHVKKSIATGDSPKDHAVLTRTRLTLRLLEKEFLLARIPYTIAGGMRILERKDVKDVLSFLRISAAGASHLAFERSAGLIPGIGPKALRDVVDAAAGGDLITAVRDRVQTADAAGKGKQKGVQAWKTYLGHVSHIRSQEKLEDQVEVAGTVVLSYLKDLDDVDSNFKEDLKGLASTFTPDPESGDPVPLQFLDELALAADSLDPSDDVATLSTVHAAKGKEWPHVWVAAVEEGILPLAFTDSPEEERRIAFVALSRAKTHLVLSWARSRMVHGRTQSQTPSQYLRQLEDRSLAEFSPALPSKTRRFGGMW